MKKEDFLSIFVYLLMLLIALFIGLQIIQPAVNDLNYSQAQSYEFAIITIIIGVVINALIFELGHILGAKIAGYGILSVNILGFNFFRAGGKWRFRFKGFNGLTGETKIFAKKAKSSPRLHLFGPLIFYILEFIAVILLFVFLPKDNVVHHAGLIVAGIGAMLIVYNIMPFRLDTLTDGYYLQLLSKKVNVEAYNELTRIEAAVYENKEVTDVKVFDQITTLTATVNMYKYYEYLDKKDYENALSIIEPIITTKTSLEEDVRGRAQAQKLYILLITKPKEAVDLYWNEELTTKDRKFIANDATLETLRAYLLFNALVSKSESEAAYTITRVPKALRLRVNDNRKEQEITLFNECLAKARELNPDWHLENPKFNTASKGKGN
jgi:hypothetical protein